MMLNTYMYAKDAGYSLVGRTDDDLTSSHMAQYAHEVSSVLTALNYS